MAYVGNPIDTQNTFQSLVGKRFSGDGSTTAFTLDVAPSSTLDIEVFVGNVRQDPNSAYTLSGTTLTFTGAPPSGTNNIYVVHQAKSVGTINAPANSITSDQLNTAFLTGATDIGAGIADADLFLVDDGASGTLRKVAASRLSTYISPTSATDSFTINGSTPTLTIGDAGAEDTKIVFDGNAQDFHIGLDDSADDLVIGTGSTVGTNSLFVIENGGNVGIGETVPLGKVHIKNGDSGASSVSGDKDELVIENNGHAGITTLATDSTESGMFFGHTSDTRAGEIYTRLDTTTMTIGTRMSGGLVTFLSDNGSERMRIDSSGGFLVGKTADNQASTGFQITGSNLHNVTSTNSGTGSSTFMVHDGSGLNFYVNFTGQVFYRVALSNLSDQRLKENVIDLDKGLDDILKIKPRRFDWIEGEGEKNQTGFIAQELEEAGLEELVSHYKGASLDDAKAVNQVGLIPILVKAVQELSEKVKKLEG